MPKIARTKPARLVEIEDRLHEAFAGGYVTQTTVGRYVGLKNHSAVREWLDGVPYIKPGKTKLYAVDQIARKIFQEELV